MSLTKNPQQKLTAIKDDFALTSRLLLKKRCQGGGEMAVCVVVPQRGGAGAALRKDDLRIEEPGGDTR